ncbi:RHS repeat-associated core domain-containing protein [Paraflavitalea speifideaquila]|uniref:RHS repeat domain-containing protein n=1 Tax=Paraflavitalea speifideaquila TaxID=3076558 RepID=UPI0028E72C93|nr:RHS repeat-associated core domain-containing protein [Paraflavitalea speifideiaquila]
MVRETGFDGLIRDYARDGTGKIIRVDKPGNKHALYEYDLAGRITRIEHSDGSWELFSYDANGRMIEAANEHSKVTLQRDTAGRIISDNQDGYLVESKYDRLGRRYEIVSNLGATVKVDRDEAGNISSLQAGNAAGADWAAKLSCNALGLETERLLPGGIVATFQYDRNGRPVEQAVGNNTRRMRQRIYAWNVNDRLQSMVNGLTRGIVQYGYDEFANLAWAKYEDNKLDFRTPDKTGNLYRTRNQDDRTYGAGGRLLTANGTRYEYDEAGNLLSKCLADGKCWRYEWQGNGMLKKVIRPDGKKVGFEYDALGRRTAKIFDGHITRWVWNGNIPLHEWKYPLNERPVTVINEWGDISKDKTEPTRNIITWIFDEGTFRPAAKLQGTQQYSIIADYLGTPVEMYDGEGQASWSVEYDIYGKIRKQYTGKSIDCPFRYQGQYEDEETGLYYNRFRYYAPGEGRYISQDPIRMVSGQPDFYAYVHDPNGWVDVLGLDCKPGYHYRQGKASDPGLDDFVNGLQSRGVTVVGKNLEIVETATGKVVGEVDVLTTHAAIQYKNGGSSAAAITDQIQNKTEPYVTKPVIGFVEGANGTTKAAVRTVKNAGDKVLVTNDIDLLAAVIK